MKLKYLLLLPLFLNHPIQTKDDLIGKNAPLFKSDAVFPNGSVKSFNLKNYIGKRLVIYFYPMDNTPGCSKQARIFRDNINKLKKHNIMVIGISADSIKSHKNFQKKYKIPYILVSDSRRKQTISKKYGTNSFFLSKRKTFLVDKSGKIFKKFDKVDIENQVDQIIYEFKKHK